MVDPIVLWTVIGVPVTLALGIATLIRTEVFTKRQANAQRAREEAANRREEEREKAQADRERVRKAELESLTGDVLADVVHDRGSLTSPDERPQPS
jgi:hypothetical protein